MLVWEQNIHVAQFISSSFQSMNALLKSCPKSREREKFKSSYMLPSSSTTI